MMYQNEPKARSPSLTICIATYNRARYIGETLDSILAQIQGCVELVVVDGASPDHTPEVLARYVAQFPGLRYYREQENSGVDGDYDKAVSYARGDYCWLMSDDDLLRPDAVARVLDAIRTGVDLVVVNSEIRSADFSALLQPQCLKIEADAAYTASEAERFFLDAANYLSFIGGVVVRRSVWLERDRSSYYGSLFVHVGVLFQKPLENGAYLISDPLIVIRYGNAMWTSRGFEIWMFKWPSLIWSFAGFSDQAKAGVYPREPWRLPRKLVLQRGIGGYGLQEYRRHIAARARWWSRVMPWLVAMIPAWLVNLLASVYCIFVNKGARSGLYDLVRSPHATRLGRYLARHFSDIR